MPKKSFDNSPTTEKATGYRSFNGTNKSSVLSSHNSSVEKFDAVLHKTVASSDSVSTRAPYSRDAYLQQRPGEAPPSTFRDVIHACRSAYLKVGVVRNVIDLMTDFACEDLQVLHADKKVEAFIKVWIAKAQVKDATDEFVRHLLVDGNVVVKRTTAKLTKPVETQWMEKTMADADTKLYTERKELESREIPWRYTFLNVAALEWIGGEEAKALGERRLAFRPSKSLLNSIRSAKTLFQQQLIDRLPVDVKNAVLNKKGDLIELDMDKIYVAHNKKDSWEDWAPPFLYSVLGEIFYKDKLRQAELAAMDGWINVIRLWKLGDHKEGIIAAEGSIERLIGILENNPGGGVMDLVWDSMIDMEPFYPPVEKILGAEKYVQVNKDILIGLGVPDVLLGGEGANFSNSFIQLKTLVEKLNYIRSKLKDWLYEEIHILCDAMDITTAPKVRFSMMNLEDEASNRKLILGLLDRHVISVEAVLQAYGQDYLIELERMRVQQDHLKAAKVKPLSPLDPKPVGAKPVGAKPPGRPTATKDSSTRKTREAKPRRTAASKELVVFALDAVDAIDEYIIPVCMDSMGVSNARKLTSEQKEELNALRASVLACITPKDDLSKDSMLNIMEKIDSASLRVLQTIGNAIEEFTINKGTQPTLAQRKRLEAVAWASIQGA